MTAEQTHIIEMSLNILNDIAQSLKTIAENTAKENPTDINERARAIKDYCEGFPNCDGCRFCKGYPIRCSFGICPQEWNLPEREEGGKE